MNDAFGRIRKIDSNRSIHTRNPGWRYPRIATRIAPLIAH